jgi:HK97 family phage portal protein
MGLWSRLVSALRKDTTPVGSELGLDEWSSSAAGVPVSAVTALHHVAVLACVSILAQDIAKIPVAVYRRLKNHGREVVEDHPLTRLLRRPNGWQTAFDFKMMMQSALALRSNAYAVKISNLEGVVEQLIPVHPDRVTLYEAPSGDVFYQVTRQGLHETAVLRDMPIRIHAEDMLHVRWMPTWHSLLGTSRIALMRDAVGLGMGLEQQAARLVGNGARPSGLLESDKPVSKEARERIKADWKDAHAGWRNTGKTAILEEGLKWRALAVSNVDAEFMEQRRYQLEDVARGFRMPLHKLGVIGEGAAAALPLMEQAYLNDTLSPWCECWAARLTFDWRVDQEDDPKGRLEVGWDYDAFHKADLKTRLEAYRTGIIGMVYTPNEPRRREGLPEVAGGDTLYQPTNMAPIGFTPAGPGSGPGSDTTGAPAPGGDGDPHGLPGDAPAPGA